MRQRHHRVIQQPHRVEVATQVQQHPRIMHTPHQSEYSPLRGMVAREVVMEAIDPVVVLTVNLMLVHSLSSSSNAHCAAVHMKNMSLKYMQPVVKVDQKTYRK